MFSLNVSLLIRTPMNAIIGMVGLLADFPLSKPEAECVNIIHDSSKSLLSLLNTILDFAKLESEKLDLAVRAQYDLTSA